MHFFAPTQSEIVFIFGYGLCPSVYGALEVFFFFCFALTGHVVFAVRKRRELWAFQYRFNRHIGGIAHGE